MQVNAFSAEKRQKNRRNLKQLFAIIEQMCYNIKKETVPGRARRMILIWRNDYGRLNPKSTARL